MTKIIRLTTVEEGHGDTHFRRFIKVRLVESGLFSLIQVRTILFSSFQTVRNLLLQSRQHKGPKYFPMNFNVKFTYFQLFTFKFEG